MSRIGEMKQRADARLDNASKVRDQIDLTCWLLDQVSAEDLENAVKLVDSLDSVGGRDVAPLQDEIIAKLAYYYKIRGAE